MFLIDKFFKFLNSSQRIIRTLERMDEKLLSVDRRLNHLNQEMEKVHKKLNLILLGTKPKTSRGELSFWPNLKTIGGSIVYIVKADNPDVQYAITHGDVIDSEGNVVPEAQLTYDVSSTDSAVVMVTPDSNDSKMGNAHFGAPGQATVNLSITDSKGTVLAVGAKDFTVTAGDPAAIQNVSISFGDLQEAP
jgi:hypothetical protein